MSEMKSITDKIDSDVELLMRHIEMLKVIRTEQPVGIIKLSELLDIPKHKIRYSLRLLEKDGAIIPSQDGARTTDNYEEYMANIESYLKDLAERVRDLQSLVP